VYLTNVRYYDRRGRRNTALRNGITTTWTYNDADEPLTQTHSGGTLGGLAINWTYDNALRRGVVTAKNGTNVLQAADYYYDPAGRLQTVVDGSVSATYAYHPNSTLIATLALTNGPGTGSGLGVSQAYDKLNRLLSITSRAYGTAATNLPVSFDPFSTVWRQFRRRIRGNAPFLAPDDSPTSKCSGKFGIRPVVSYCSA